MGWVALLGLSNTVLTAILLFFFSSTVSDKPMLVLKHWDIVLFLMILVASVSVNKLFQVHVIRITFDILCEFELALTGRLRMASLEAFEEFGTEKVYTVLNDVRILGNFPAIFINTFNAVMMIICCIIYLLFVYFPAALILLAVMVALLVLNIKFNTKIMGKLREVRALQDRFYLFINDLVGGFREIKMSTVKNRNIYRRFILPNREEGKVIGMRTADDYLDSELIGRLSWFLVIGMIIYLLPSLLPVSSSQTRIFLVVILYLMGPVNIIFSMIPYFGTAKISIERLNNFDEIFIAVEKEADETESPADPFAFESIRFDNICYEYMDSSRERSFVLGPLDLTIRKGDILFITGDNGSGKSTFFNILTGLYRPTSGDIYLNGKKLESDDFQRYRDCIAAIFTAPHLFSENYEDFGLAECGNGHADLIDRFRMREVVAAKSVQLKNLSKGQQKRLLMIYALLERKPILALDEWAAEQDPMFREYFYDELLGDLRSAGKTVVAITHDDGYFDRADAVVRFDFGKIARISYGSNELTDLLKSRL